VRNEALADLDAAAARLRAALEGQFRPVEAIGAAFLEQRRECLAAGTPLSPERLTGMREVIWHQLRLLPAADGAGVVAAPGVVAGKERHLEWWQRTRAAEGAAGEDGDGGAGGAEGFARIRLNLDGRRVSSGAKKPGSHRTGAWRHAWGTAMPSCARNSVTGS
jgi:hypothetical protein